MNELIDAQNTSHVELSGPNPATSCSKSLAEAVRARLGNETPSRLRTVSYALHTGLQYTLRLRASWQRVQRIPICALGSPQQRGSWRM